MNDKFSNLQSDIILHMEKCITSFKEHIHRIYVGRVSPSMLDKIQVKCYGILTPLSQLTNIIVENPSTLSITVFDHKIVKSVEKAILLSDLKLVPVVFENIVRITLPILTEERRLFLIKMVRVEAEKSKISIRNIRRVAHDKIKIFSKNKEISIDEEHYFQSEIQKLINIQIKEIDIMLANKESELMKF